jgi:hypothetical protein
MQGLRETGQEVLRKQTVLDVSRAIINTLRCFDRNVLCQREIGEEWRRERYVLSERSSDSQQIP